MISNVRDAFDKTGSRLSTLAPSLGGHFSFKLLFGGLEFITRGTPNQYAETLDGYTVAWDDLGIRELDGTYLAAVGKTPQQLVIHELGHILENRTAGQSFGMRGVATGQYYGWLPQTHQVSISRNSEFTAGTPSDKERIADLFLFWVYSDEIPNIFDELLNNPNNDAQSNARARSYIEGGSHTWNGITVNSPGIGTWALQGALFTLRTFTW